MPDGHRIVTNGADWMRDMEKRTMTENRRPRITHARDLMGPGLAPRAVQITDWSGPETEFNGVFYTEPNALHTPDPTKYWMGHSWCQIEGFGIQQVWDYRGTTNPPVVKTRRFSLSGGIRVFGPWA